MQTFLPYPSFRQTARVLDRARLGKQRVEALQVWRALNVPGYGWRHHPAAAMWRGYDRALIAYGLAICDEWIRQGHPDTVRAQLAAASRDRPLGQTALARRGLLPPWLGHPEFHRAHQSALVRKDPGKYRALFPGVPENLPYVWPKPAAAKRS
ncbi:MAG: MSMEG_6728 family protein [Candidatus Dormibacteria bacterium]